MKAIPNILSFARLALCPVFVWTFFYRSPVVAFAIFAFASLLDVVDGFLARRLHAITTLGKILDPVADKILQLSAVVCFTVKGILPLFSPGSRTQSAPESPLCALLHALDRQKRRPAR